MGKKKRGHPDVEELISRPWCYYCERDFEDLKLLISHQKAKHFKCDRCGKRLNTAGGLSVHMNQVHKESLSSVENALPNRQGLDIEIFGMEGVPEDIMQQHNQRIIQNFYKAQEERHAATGNPPSGAQGVTKKIKYETPEELKKRLADHRIRAAARKAAGGAVNGNAQAGKPGDTQSPAQSNSPFAPPAGGFPYPPPQNFPPAGGFPPFQTTSLPARPPGSSGPITTGLPQRPSVGDSAYQGASASTVDELVANAARQGDDIDQIIRMAESGIKPPKAGEEAAAATEKKGKKEKEKNVRMVYGDTDISPEEKMALMPRYAFIPAS